MHYESPVATDPPRPGSLQKSSHYGPVEKLGKVHGYEDRATHLGTDRWLGTMTITTLSES